MSNPQPEPDEWSRLTRATSNKVVAQRFIIGLLIIQTFVIAFLAWSSSGLSGRMSLVEGHLASKHAKTGQACPETPRPRSLTLQTLSATQVRQIVAEELSRAIDQRPRLESDEPSGIDEADRNEESADAIPPDPAQAQSVIDEIDHHIGVGTISPQDMYLLQAKIGQLDRETRRKVLRRLVTAMNEGVLKGRL